MKNTKGATEPTTSPAVGISHCVPPSPRSQKLRPEHHHHSVKGKLRKKSHRLPPTIEAQPLPQPILRQPTSQHGGLSYRRYDSMPNIAHTPQQTLRDETITTKGLVRHHRSDPERPALPLVPATPVTNTSPRPYPATPPIANTVRFDDPFRRGAESRRRAGVGGGGRAGGQLAASPAIEGRRIVSGPAPTSALKMKDRYPAIPQPYPQPQAGGFSVGIAQGYGHGDGYDDPRHPNRPRTVSTPAPRLGPATTSPYTAPAPTTARSRKPDPRRVLTALELIRGGEFNIKEYLNTFDLMRDHQLDQVDDEQRERERERVRVRARTFADAKRPDLRKAEEIQRGDKPALPSVLSAPLRKTSIYASTAVVVDGHEHDVPIIVVHTVEELRRTALHDHDFLRGNPNSDRVAELMHVYDAEQSPDHIAIPPRPPTRPYGSGRPVAGMGGRIHGPEQEHGLGAGAGLGFGMSASLHEEASADLGALLSTYISSLPEPVLRAFLFEAIWDMCGVDDEFDDARDDYFDAAAVAMHTNTNTNANRRDSSKRDAVAWSNTDLDDMDMWPPTLRMERTYTSPEDATKIATAQLLLHLLPSPHFSLLVYLMYFFSDVAEREESNGLGVKELARVFGASIFGRRDPLPPVSPAVRPGHESTPRTRKRADTTAGWQEHELRGILRNTRKRDGETMMRWFLRRWGPISDGLFDVLKDVEMGLFRRTNMRKDSFGKDILASASAGVGANMGVGGGFAQGLLVPPGVLDEDEDEDASVLGSMTTVHDRVLEDDSGSDIYVDEEEEGGQRKEGRDTPHPVKGDRLDRAGEYFAGGFSFATQEAAGSPRPRSARRDSTADKTMLRQKETMMGVDVENLEQNVIGDEDVVVVAPFNEEGDPVAQDGSPEVRGDSSSTIEGLDERFGDLDSDISNLMHEFSPPSSIGRPPGLDDQKSSIPEIVVKNATPPNSTPPLPPAKSPATNNMGDVVAALKQENSALQNTVSRLEAELARAKRDICAVGQADVVAPSAAGLDKGAAQAVEIVAEIRKLMAKN